MSRFCICGLVSLLGLGLAADLAFARSKPNPLLVRPVVAMVLHAGPGATLEADKEVKPLRDMDLLREGDIIKVRQEPVRVVFMAGGHGERILPNRKATVGKMGCAPPGSVEKLESKTTRTVRGLVYRLLTSERAGVGVAR
jgi:hypothetical protein